MAIERKRTEWIDRTIDAAAKTITFTGFRQTATDDKPVTLWVDTFDWSLASTANVDYAIGHGFAARIGDKAALKQGSTMEEKRAKLREMIDHYELGTDDWELKASRAPVDPEKQATNALAKMTPEQIAALMEAAHAQLAQLKANAEGAKDSQGE